MIACPPEPSWRTRLARGVEVRTKYASCRTWRQWRNPVFTRLCWLASSLSIKPLKNLRLFRQSIFSASSLGQDSRSSICHHLAYPDPCPPSSNPRRACHPLRAIRVDSLKGKVSCDVGCRSANTNAPAPASTSGNGCLTSLFRVAKGEVHPWHLFCKGEPQAGPVRPRLSRGLEISLEVATAISNGDDVHTRRRDAIDDRNAPLHRYRTQTRGNIVA